MKTISEPKEQSLLWPLLVQGKACSLLPSLGEGLEAPRDIAAWPPGRTTGYSFTHDISHRKSARFKHDMHVSVFLFSGGLCYNWWKSIHGCFPTTVYCTVVPAVWASPLESSGGAPRFSGFGVQTQCSLSLYFLVFYSLVLLNKKLHGREVCSTLVARLAPKLTDVIQMREKWEWDFAILLCVPKDPQSNMGPPGKISIKRWQKLKVFTFEWYYVITLLVFKWHYWRAICYSANIYFVQSCNYCRKIFF